MKRSFALLALSWLLLSCRSQAAPPDGVTILDASKIQQILAQCSRGAPEKGEGSWNPSAAEIMNFERALPDALKRAEPSHDWSEFPVGWSREYVGIVRHDQRFIYGNYLPTLDAERGIEPPTLVCDGGPSFFGAEWDVQAKRISHLEFNGVA